MENAWLIVICVIGVAAIIIFALSIRIVKQGTAVIVERLGKYHKTLGTGMKFIIPMIDRALPAISLKEQVADFKPQPVITKDNVTMQIDSVVFFQIVDPKLYTYGIERPMSAIENLTATTLRNIVGELELDETLSSRDTVNTKMREIIDTATDPWGIKVNRVELKNILPPAAIQESMEKQMRAERERRENILLAEGQKRSQILVAEGEKEAAILRAEGQQEAINRIMAAKPDAAYLTLQGYEALKAMAEGQATKIIVPNDLANVATLFTTLKETVKTDAPSKTSTKKAK